MPTGISDDEPEDDVLEQLQEVATATMTTGNGWHLIGLARARGRRLESARAAAYPVIRDQLAGHGGRLVLGYVELAAAVKPLLLTKDIGGHRLAPADL